MYVMPMTRCRWTWTTPAKVSAKVMNAIAEVMIQKLHMLSTWL